MAVKAAVYPSRRPLPRRREHKSAPLALLAVSALTAARSVFRMRGPVREFRPEGGDGGEAVPPLSDVPVLRQAVRLPVRRGDHVVKKVDAQFFQQFLQMQGGNDVIVRGGAGPARMVVGQENAVRV